MDPNPPRFPWPKWPFYLANALVAALIALALLRPHGRFDFCDIALVVVGFGVAALLSLLPHLVEAHWLGKQSDAVLPSPAPDEPPSPSTAADPGEALAEIAVLAWRIKKRAELEPETQRVILRNAGKILDALSGAGVQVVSYLGRKLDVGSNVEILDAVAGEYNRVIEESDPQVQIHGRLARRAIVTVGNGETAAAAKPNEAEPSL